MPSLDIQENIPLSRYTSMHVGGSARYFTSATNDSEVQAAVIFAREQKIPFFVLGKGSNTLFPDKGYDGLVILMSDRTIKVADKTIVAASGVFMRQLVNVALAANLTGLEELAGIPGTVGGAVRGNAGTWSTETKDKLVNIDVLKAGRNQLQITEMSANECEFGYRHSIFKEHPDWIVLRARFELSKGDAVAGQKMVMKDLSDRHQKQPYDAPSAGSIFKNPDKENGIFSGQLIEKAGLKGARRGGAQISEKHANFIVNRGKATSDDVRFLIRKAQQEVQDRYGISLEPEIQII